MVINAAAVVTPCDVPASAAGASVASVANAAAASLQTLAASSALSAALAVAVSTDLNVPPAAVTAAANAAAVGVVATDGSAVAAPSLASVPAGTGGGSVSNASTGLQAGVAIAVIAIVGASAGLFIYMRRRWQQEQQQSGKLLAKGMQMQTSVVVSPIMSPGGMSNPMGAQSQQRQLVQMGPMSTSGGGGSSRNARGSMSRSGFTAQPSRPGTGV